VEKRVGLDDESEKEEKKVRQLTPLQSLEIYSGNHPETVEQLLEWPYRRFQKAFDNWQKRNQVEEIENRKNLHVSALYANTNYDDEKNNREDHIKNLDEFYELLKDMVWKGPKEVEKEEKELAELEASDPFLAAGKRNRAKINPMEIKFRSED